MALAVAAVVLLALAGFWWWQQSQGPQYRSMTEGTVTSSTVDGGDLRLTVGYDVNGRRYSTQGSVDRDAFEFQGRSVWVCYSPDDPGDAGVRLPYDPLCNVR